MAAFNNIQNITGGIPEVDVLHSSFKYHGMVEATLSSGIFDNHCLFS